MWRVRVLEQAALLAPRSHYESRTPVNVKNTGIKPEAYCRIFCDSLIPSPIGTVWPLEKLRDRLDVSVLLSRQNELSKRRTAKFTYAVLQVFRYQIIKEPHLIENPNTVIFISSLSGVQIIQYLKTDTPSRHDNSRDQAMTIASVMTTLVLLRKIARNDISKYKSFIYDVSTTVLNT